MILGIGSDMIDIRRIEQAIERFGDRFLDRIFTDASAANAIGAPTARPAMRVDLLPRKPVRKRSAPGFATAYFGATSGRKFGIGAALDAADRRRLTAARRAYAGRYDGSAGRHIDR